MATATMQAATTQAVSEFSSDSSPELAFLSRVQRDNAPLRQLVMEFNRYPLRYAHATWIPFGWPANVMENLRDSRAENRLNSLLLSHWGHPRTSAFNFAQPSYRIALLDSENLEQLTLLAGAAVRWEQLSKILERDQVRELKEEIGDYTYRFAMLRAPLLAGESLSIVPPARSSAEIAGIGETICKDGLELIASCLAGTPPAMRTRLALKFPRSFARIFLIDRPAPVNPRVWRLVKRILLQEVDPSWETLLS